MNSNPRKNDRIRVKEIRVIFNNENIGILTTKEALIKAKALGLDLVEISPNATPPVCKIIDYGKYKYEQEKSHKKQTSHKDHEVKFGVNIDSHDYEVKLNKVNKFLDKGDKVKVVIVFKGRQIAHKEIGFELADRILVDLNLKSTPKNTGRNITFYVDR